MPPTPLRQALDADPRPVRHIAAEAGIHEVNLAQIAAGRKDPSYLTGLAIAEALGLRLDRLAGLSDKKRTPFRRQPDEHPLDTLIRRHGSTQQHFAEHVCVSNSTVSKARRNLVELSLSRLALVADRTGTELHSLARAMRASLDV